MSTLMNYTFQSFNFRGRAKLRPYYDLISNIAAEEYSHIELVSATINLFLSGTTKRADRNTAKDQKAAPLAGAVNARNSYHFIASGQTALPVDSMGTRGRVRTYFPVGTLSSTFFTIFSLSVARVETKSAFTKW